jgi:hypothetical protein
MFKTRDELQRTFDELSEQVGQLTASGAAEEKIWEMFGRMAQQPPGVVAPQDNQWWWTNLYKTMERHGLSPLGHSSASGKV